MSERPQVSQSVTTAPGAGSGQAATLASHGCAIRNAVCALNTALRLAHDAGFEVSLSLVFSGGPYKQVDAAVAPLSAFAKELRNV